MATEDLMLTVLARATYNYRFLIADVMVTFDLLADEAWRKIGAYITTNRELLQLKFPRGHRTHRQDLFDWACIETKLFHSVGGILIAISKFYENTAEFHLMYERPDRSEELITFCQNIVDGGLNQGLQSFIAKYRNNFPEMQMESIFSYYISNFSHFYYTATEEEWCFLIEQFLSAPTFPAILCNNIYHFRLYTKASLRALAKYGFLDFRFTTIGSGVVMSNFLFETIRFHYNAAMEFLIELGVTEKYTITTVPIGIQPSQTYEINSVTDIIRYFIQENAKKIIVDMEGKVIESERQKQTHVSYLRTLRRYTASKRLPMLMLRQRYWEEYWRKVETAE
jgi:hypothetical protein